MAQERFFTIDWSELKPTLLAAIDGKTELKLNRSNILSHVQVDHGYSSWSGFTRAQSEKWLREGYVTEAISGLTEFVPPIREKRKFVFGEEGDEFHFDLAASGNDNYMSHFTKREAIPGVAIEASIMFSASTNAEIVNAYNVWLCKIAYSLDGAGIDCQITLDFPSWNMNRNTRRISAGEGTLYHNIVRVKKENEASDFLSWSAMLSPAALRSYGFAVGDLHMESLGLVTDGSWGRGIPDRVAWKCWYDAERRVIRIENVYSGHYGQSFPADDMTRQFRDCLKEMQGKLTN